jgi:hypothetical protein
MSKYKFILILIMVFCICGSAFANPLKAEFKSITGTVEIKTPAGNWTPISSALDTGVVELKNGVMISTGFQSEARIEMGSSVLQLESFTRINLIELVESDGYEHIEMSIVYGRVRGELTPMPGNLCVYSIHSSEISIEISGGIFEATAMNVKVYRGKAVFTGNDNASRITITEAGIAPPALSPKDQRGNMVTPTVAGEGGRATVPLSPSLSSGGGGSIGIKL